jgi:3-hydroxyacyl-CoA dehydrogenase
VGVERGCAEVQARGLTLAPWIEAMRAAGATAFYRNREGVRECWNPATGQYAAVAGQEGRISLAWLPDSATVWKNAGTTLQDLGDGILNVAFHTKMNSIGAEVIEGLNKAIDLAEGDPARWRGVVVSNEGAQFSAGANVGMIFMLAVEQEWDDLDFAVRTFQRTMMRMRYSGIPVVAAPHNLALGGGCELCLHADKVVAHAETYIGLVEFGIGVIPAGGGTKEFALRLSDELREGDIRTNRMRDRFLTIGQAKVATSAYEAFELGYLRPGVDEVVVNRKEVLARAKRAALELADAGYTRPIERRDIHVMGAEGMGLVLVGAHSMLSGGFISEHDRLISEKLGYVLCGGDLSVPTAVSEQYLLDLERKAFVELCMQRKTLERMQSLIQAGKILRN